MMPGIGVTALSPCACPTAGADVRTRQAAAASRRVIFMALTLRPSTAFVQDRPLPGDDLAVPPEGPAAVLERLCEQTCTIAILARVADEHVRHGLGPRPML